MKIIGWEKKGNLVRFYLGKDDLDYYGADDWDNKPYEHNACTVPDFVVEDCVHVVMNFNTTVFEAKDDAHYKGNSPFSMNDFKDRKIPILYFAEALDFGCYSKCLEYDLGIPVYMGDDISDIFVKLKPLIMFTDYINNYSTVKVNIPGVSTEILKRLANEELEDIDFETGEVNSDAVAQDWINIMLLQSDKLDESIRLNRRLF